MRLPENCGFMSRRFPRQAWWQRRQGDLGPRTGQPLKGAFGLLPRSGLHGAFLFYVYIDWILFLLMLSLFFPCQGKQRSYAQNPGPFKWWRPSACESFQLPSSCWGQQTTDRRGRDVRQAEQLADSFKVPLPPESVLLATPAGLGARSGLELLLCCLQGYDLGPGMLLLSLYRLH